jgi:hypothetical protein
MRKTLLALLSLLLCACAAVNSAKFDNSDYAIDTYTPGSNEITRAEQRAKKFWLENSSRYDNEPHFLAIDTTKLLEGEIVQDLWPKLINSAHTSSFFARGTEGYPQVDIYCVMIFDTRTGKFVSNQGYAVVDLPSRGQVARFGNYIARFIGSGS